MKPFETFLFWTVLLVGVALVVTSNGQFNTVVTAATGQVNNAIKALQGRGTVSTS